MKARLLRAFELSDAERINRITSTLTLGDKKPSQLLKEMKALSHNLFTEKALKTLWLQKLPPTIHTILMTCDRDLENLAALLHNSYRQLDRCSLMLERICYQSPMEIRKLAFQYAVALKRKFLDSWTRDFIADQE